MVHPKAKFFPELQANGSVKRFLGGSVTSANVTTIQDLMQAEGFVPHKGTIMAAMCLSMKHYSTSNSNSSFTHGAKFGGKRQKVTTEWNRLYVFADLSSPGHCFVLLFSDKQEAAHFFRFCQGIPIVGTAFYIIEGYCSDRKHQLGPLPIVEHDAASSVVPIKLPQGPAVNVGKLLPSVKFTNPVAPGDQMYFCFNNCKDLLLDMFTIQSGGCCGGFACDRAACLKDRNHYCGCFHTHQTSGLQVGECKISLPCPLEDGSQSEKTLYVSKHRSWRTSNLFFKDFRGFCVRYSEDEQFVHVRNKVAQCAEYIRTQGGGWTVVGWFRQGEVADASEDGGDRIANHRIQVHISLLIPTDLDVLKSEEYKKLLVDYAPPAVTVGSDDEETNGAVQ